MTEHTPTPWRVFLTPDGLRHVGIGSQDGGGILDSGFGVWQWNDAEGIANANLVVRAVNSHDALVQALQAFVKAYEMQDACNFTDELRDAYATASALTSPESNSR